LLLECTGDSRPLLPDSAAAPVEMANERRFGESKPLLGGKLGVLPSKGVDVLLRGGRGNRGPLSFFRLASLKNVVVVDTTCVVVVVAYTPWSPELPSDLDESDIRATGRASEELDSSPYGGGALCDRGASAPPKATYAVAVEG